MHGFCDFNFKKHNATQKQDNRRGFFAIGYVELLSTLNRPGSTLEYFKNNTGKIVDFKKASNSSLEIKKYTGEVLIISNRNIDKIINITQEKASVCISIPTAYEEDYNKVEKVIKDTLNYFKKNNQDVTKIEYLGINELSDSSIKYQVLITCNRGKQWAVKRAFLKEIKIAYEKNNIKIPYNQLEVHNGTKI